MRYIQDTDGLAWALPIQALYVRSEKCKSIIANDLGLKVIHAEVKWNGGSWVSSMRVTWFICLLHFSVGCFGVQQAEIWMLSPFNVILSIPSFSSQRFSVLMFVLEFLKRSVPSVCHSVSRQNLIMLDAFFSQCSNCT